MRRSISTFWPVVVLTALSLAACSGEEEPDGPFSNNPLPSETVTTTLPPVSVVASPTPPAPPAQPPATRGLKSPSCVNGWITPKRGTPRFTDPLGIVRRTVPVQGEFVVMDMRYFVGPESPPSEMGYISGISRWYIKLYVKDDWTYQGRFLVEQRRFGRGIAAVAPYDTGGFRSPDWSGFQWNSADPEPKLYAGLPGAWSGVRYDFVNGGQGLDIPGLPDGLLGCLEGT